jgi:arsenate reductase (thioredoxin)
MTAPRRVLFLCTHNSARSQMAEGLLRELGGPDYEVFSAGTVKTTVRPEAVAVMSEIDIDISKQISKTLDQFLEECFDEVITVCDDANDVCPVFPGAVSRRHWSIPDPSMADGSSDDRINACRLVRDELQVRIQETFLAD